MLPIRQCLGTHTSCQISLVRRRWPPLTTALIIGISIRRTSHKSNLTLYKGHILHNTKDTVHIVQRTQYMAMTTALIIGINLSHHTYGSHCTSDRTHHTLCIAFTNDAHSIQRISHWTHDTAHIAEDTAHEKNTQRSSLHISSSHPHYPLTHISCQISQIWLSDFPSLIFRFPYFDNQICLFWFSEFPTMIFIFPHFDFHVSLFWVYFVQIIG